MNGIPDWLLVFERLGPGMAILVFFLAVCWKLLPPARALLGAWTAQTNAITKLIPSVVHALESIAHSAESMASDRGRDRKVARLRRDRDDADPVGDTAGQEAR